MTSRCISIARGLPALAALALAACPNPVSDLTVDQVTDRSAPIVSIASPAESTTYTQTVVVRATAVDPGGRLKAVSWVVTGALGLLEQGTVDMGSIGADGSLGFQFSTLTYSGPIAVTISAKDWNDNVGQFTRTLASPGSSLSSFAAVPGNGKVTLSWEPVPSATYTVFYTTNGSLPGQGYGLQRTVSANPYDLIGLTNGAMHVFLLRASAGGHDYWSGYVRAIPLASTTLAPRVRGELGRVLLDWSSIPAIDQFEVLRSSDRAGAFTNISGTIASTSFTDTDTGTGHRFYYQVRPAMNGSLASAPVAGEASPLPLDSQRRIGYLVPPGSQINDVVVVGTRAYVANYNQGFQILDVSDPRHPVYVSGVTGIGNATGITVVGSTAYVTAGQRLRVIDFSIDETNPDLIGSSADLGASAWDVAINQGYAFVTTGSGIRKIDLSNLSDPSPANYPIGGGAYGIASFGQNIYVAAASSVLILSASMFNLAGSFSASRAMDVAIDVQAGVTYAYVADEYFPGLRVFNVTNPGSVGTLGTLSLSGMSPRGVSVRWPMVALTGYITSGGAALQVANVRDPANPRLAFTVLLPAGAERVAAVGDYAYVADSSLGLQVVNIANPAAPAAAGSQSFAAAYDLALDGDIAVVSALASPNSLRIYDLSAPGSPQPLGSPYAAAAWPYGVALRWPYAYLAESNKLEIVDLSNPSVPVQAGLTSLIGNGNDIAIAGDYALVADSGNSMDVVDISDPTKPSVVGNFLTPAFANAVGAQGAYGFVATLSAPATLYVVSLENPLQPAAVGSVTLGAPSGQVNDLTVAGDRVYLATSNGSGTGHGLVIIDVSNPKSPTILNSALMGFDGRSVEVLGDFALVSPLSGSVFRVISISNPASPRLVGTINQQASSIRASGNYLYVANYLGNSFTALQLW